MTRPPAETRQPGPDFLCVGAQKAGTAWLYDQLQHHPDFWMPPIKELHYFDGHVRRAQQARLLHRRAAIDLAGTNRAREQESYRALDDRDLAFLPAFARLIETRRPSLARRALLTASSWTSRCVPGLSGFHREVVTPRLRFGAPPDFPGYAQLFVHKGEKISGDVTPGYSSLGDDVVKQILQVFPGVKVVFLARDPVERFWSAVNMHARHSHSPRPDNTRALTRLLDKANHADRSYQTHIVARWRRFVPASNFGLFFFDDLLGDAADLRRRVLVFLGADPDKPSGMLPANFNRKERAAKLPLSAEFRDTLAGLLADELRASARDFGGAAALWPGKYRV